MCVCSCTLCVCLCLCVKGMRYSRVCLLACLCKRNEMPDFYFFLILFLSDHCLLYSYLFVFFSPLHAFLSDMCLSSPTDRVFLQLLDGRLQQNHIFASFSPVGESSKKPKSPLSKNPENSYSVVPLTPPCIERFPKLSDKFDITSWYCFIFSLS